MSQNKKEEMRERKTTRQCDIDVKQTLQDAENKNPTMHITCSNEDEQKLYKLQRKKLLKKIAWCQWHRWTFTTKKKEKASAPNQRHTHKKPLREKKRKNKQAMLRQKDKQTSLNFIIYNL